MKVPLSWLKEFVEITLPVEELARVLSLSGIEVAAITYVGVAGAELPWDPEQIVIANILEVWPHPNADRLVLAEVDYGGPQPHTVVTGAPNLFPYRGLGRLAHPLKSVFAREGARLYDGHAEGRVITTLKGRPVRGVMSDAMLCSEKELGISEDHEGIIILEDDAPVGVPARDVLGEVVLEIDLTPNYARCLSIVGVAREVAALTGGALRLPEPEVLMEGPPIAGRAGVMIEEPQLCPRFTVGLIEGVTIGPAPHWMQRRLRHAGMRPISNIVDISNYVMLEWGQPTHAFDADRVRDQQLIVRLARPGERLVTLDGKERALEIRDWRLEIGTGGAGDAAGQAPTADLQSPVQPVLCVCDAGGPLAVAGIMGGEASEVRETTTRVLFEAAIWEPVQIRRAARALKVPSEASRRFERGVDYALPLIAQRRCLELMRIYAGGTVAQGLIDNYPTPWQPVVLDLPPSEVARIVGVHLSAPTIAELLGRLGFGCEVRGGAGMGDFADFAAEPVVRVTVPSFRLDVAILADLCEEVARVYGYDKVPVTRMADDLPEADNHPEIALEQKVRDVLVGCGLDEVITYSLTSMPAVAKVSPAAAVAAQHLRLANPSTPEREYLRRSLLPTLLEALADNLRERERALMFEVGRVYLPTAKVVRWQQDRETDGHAATWSAEDALPAEPLWLGVAMAGPRAALSWQGAPAEPMDFFDLKGVVEGLLERLGLAERVAFAPLSDDERFHPGRSAALLLQTADPSTLRLRSGQASSGQAGSAQTDGRQTPGGDSPSVTRGSSSDDTRGRAQILSTRVGVLGELHPAVRERLEIGAPRALAAEIDLGALLAAAQPSRYSSISRFPATMQDLAIVAAVEVPAEQVAAVIRRGAGELLESLTLFDIYTGPQVGAGKRSLAYRLALRAADRTLNEEAVAKLRAKIVKQLEREIGATIRG